MFKNVTLLSMITVCSVALAGGIDQTQDFMVGMTNGVDLLLSMQNATSNNFLGILNDQSSVSASQMTEGATMATSQMTIVGSHFSWSMSAVTLPTLTLPNLQAMSLDSLAAQIPPISAIQPQ
jgi:hypothetical protein